MRLKITSLLLVAVLVVMTVGEYKVSAEEDAYCLCNFRVHKGLVDFKDLYAYKYLKDDEVYKHVSSEKEFEDKVKKALEKVIKDLQEEGLYVDRFIPRIVNVYVVRQGLNYTDATTTFDERGKVDIAIYANLSNSSVNQIADILTHEIGHLVEKFYFTDSHWDKYIQLKNPSKDMVTDKYSDEIYEVGWERSMIEVFAEDFSYGFRGGEYHYELRKNKKESVMGEFKDMVITRVNKSLNISYEDLYSYQYMGILNERLDHYFSYCEKGELDKEVSSVDLRKLGLEGKYTYKEAVKEIMKKEEIEYMKF